MNISNQDFSTFIHEKADAGRFRYGNRADKLIPDAQVSKRLLSDADRQSLLAFGKHLGVDPSSQFFTKRTKAIAFMIKLNGAWFQLNQNFFNQNSGYNDFSGGYKRFYDTLPPEFVRDSATTKLLNSFQKQYDIPEGELVLLQMQTSWVFPGDEGRCLTGQGIHTDGADRALLVVLDRHNITGARNAIYRDLQGKNSVYKPFVLEQGDALFWKDNQVFHHVEPAQVKDKRIGDPAFPQEESCGRRTVVIIHYPAMHYITGDENMNNRLMKKAKDIIVSTKTVPTMPRLQDNPTKTTRKPSKTSKVKRRHSVACAKSLCDNGSPLLPFRSSQQTLYFL